MRALTNRGAGWRALAVLLVVAFGLTACSSSKSTSSGHFEVSTADGQVSLSLDGHLPPNWPSDVPVPSDAKAAGSGSLSGGESGGAVGVYTSPQTPEQVYHYYTQNSSLRVTSQSAIGSGSTFVGTVKLAAPVAATVTIVPYKGETAIAVVIRNSTPSGTSSTAAATG